MKEIRTSIVINAPPESVWMVLTDFSSYPRWNPFITQAEGKIEPGRRITIRVRPRGSKGMTFHPTVTHVTPGRELRWLGHLLFHGIFDGEHIFKLYDEVENRTRLEHAERFTGLLSSLLHYEQTILGFEAMNRALKDEVEKVWRETAATPE